MKLNWRALAPIIVWVALYLIPVPEGLKPNQWHYFAIFAAVITGLVLESMPVGAVGLIGLTAAGLLGYVESDPNKSLRWMLSGFSESTVWLIVGAFVFAIGYRKSGLGKRIALLLVRVLGRHTLGLGYAVAFADLVLAPATPQEPQVVAPAAAAEPAARSRPAGTSCARIRGAPEGSSQRSS